MQAENAVQIQPTYEGEPLSVTAILVCNIQPANASVRTRWILPDGHITQNDQERYRMSMGKTGSEIYFFIIIQRLSYKDAGVYTCEAVERRVSVSSCNCNGFPLSSTVELVLQGMYLLFYVVFVCVVHNASLWPINHVSTCLFIPFFRDARMLLNKLDCTVNELILLYDNTNTYTPL